MVVLPDEAIKRGKLNENRFHKFMKPYSQYQKVRPYPRDQRRDLQKKFNPNTKFDYFGIGGGYENCLVLKNGERRSMAMVGDVDLSHMWDPFTDELRTFQTTAVLTKSGKWCDWYTNSGDRSGRTVEELDNVWYASFRERFVETLEDEDVIVICDYHA